MAHKVTVATCNNDQQQQQHQHDCDHFCCLLDGVPPSAPPDVPPRNPTMNRMNGRVTGNPTELGVDFEPSCLVRTPSGNVYIPSGNLGTTLTGPPAQCPNQQN
uniref:Uncharacterized protein n=1 Tax=Anopheles coluzzii TaxID=1518534 RepID=A0A8W7P162_ANOCL